mmetsp:Transcript_25321/g.28166  ORF Transcript_25321/g.28166 Transcript_25321/m.28166 type:complete len:245 (-) Transcript_25321:91-825(-)
MFIRWFLFLWCLGILLFLIFKDLPDITWEIFSFFTVWNYIVLTIFFGIGSYLSMHRYFFSDDFLRQRETIGFVGKSFLVLFQVCCVMSLLVDSVTWIILYPTFKGTEEEALLINFVSYNQHGTNFICLLIEFALNLMPVYAVHVSFALYWGVLYACFALLYKVFGGDWRYPFLDTKSPFAVAWYVGISLFILAFWFMVYGASKFKYWLLFKKKKHFGYDTLNTEATTAVNKHQIGGYGSTETTI